jgi:hypothetical protein
VRISDLNYTAWPVEQVLSCQRLPKLGDVQDVVDPYVKVEIFGITADKNKMKTKVDPKP